jgi:hypothetical protein
MPQVIGHFIGEWEFLSNFYSSEIDYEGRKYPTVEHAFQAAKTLNETTRALIASAETPRKAKRMGREVELREDWDFIRQRIMLSLLFKKFVKNSELKEKLLSTGEAYLIEGNTWHDNYWGSCDCDKCSWNEPQHNILGILLMAVRTLILNANQ